MAKKLKHIPVLGIVAVLAIGLWALTVYDDMRNVSVRTNTETKTVRTTPGDQSEAISEPEVILPALDQNAAPPITPESPPEPTNRVPGSTLSESALKDLGLEEPIEEEQIFYATATTPNDPIYPQWYTTIIDAPTAWDTTTGDSDVLVAVIDTGFALGHEDLADAWFTNAGEQGTTQSGETCWTGSPADKQTNSCDDDDNGYIDDWRGWDFAGADNNVETATNSTVGSSHGTKSAGLAGGRSNNSLGVASVNWQTTILPLQALYDEGFGYSTDITAAVYYAVEMGADVINMSLGGPSPDSFTLAAVKYAEQNNVIVVASSGNCGDTQSSPTCTGYPSPGGMGYPARYHQTIAVGATTSSDAQASFSSWGDENTIVAPGSGSIQTPTWTSSNNTNAYSATSFGTSFSAPIVAGAVSLIKGEMPNATRSEVVALLANSADKVSAMGSSEWTQRYGWGRLNVNNLLSELSEYKIQLDKAGGQIAEQSTATKPQISTSTGHSSSTAITSGAVRTYCLTTPATICRLTISGANGSIVIGDQLTNSQGITLFVWDHSMLPNNGTYNASVTANGLASNNEKLFIN